MDGFFVDLPSRPGTFHPSGLCAGRQIDLAGSESWVDDLWLSARPGDPAARRGRIGGQLLDVVVLDHRPSQTSPGRVEIDLEGLIVSSVAAVTETGFLMVASASGSQLPGYAAPPARSGSSGPRKWCPTCPPRCAASKTAALPLVNDRAMKVYGQPSALNRTLDFWKQNVARTHMPRRSSVCR